MIPNINYGVYRGKRTVSLCLCTHLNVLGRRQLNLCMRFSCEYSGNCIRFSIIAQQNIDSVLKIFWQNRRKAATQSQMGLTPLRMENTL